MTSSRGSSIFAEERLIVLSEELALSAPVANEFAAEFDVIGENRAVLDNDFDAFLAQIAPEKFVAEVSSDLLGFEINWDNVDGATGFATARIDDLG